MEKTFLSLLSGLAMTGALIVQSPYLFAQAGPTGKGPAAGDRTGDNQSQESPRRADKNTGTGQSGMPRSEMKSQSGHMAQAGMSKEKVKEVQTALKEKGFEPGEADGVAGPKTHQAIRDFQKSKNLQATGRIDDRTASALGVSTSGMQSSGGSGRTSGMSGTKSNIPDANERASGSDSGTKPPDGGSGTNPPKPTGRD